MHPDTVFVGPTFGPQPKHVLRVSTMSKTTDQLETISRVLSDLREETTTPTAWKVLVEISDSVNKSLAESEAIDEDKSRSRCE